MVEFDHFRISARLHFFVLSPGKRVEKTNAIGIVVDFCAGGESVAWVFQPTNERSERCLSIASNCSWVGKPTLQ